jgi:hypothetical protein
MSFTTPVLLIVWQRPELLDEQVAFLKRNQVLNIYISCDGPNQKNKHLVDQVREKIHILFDWDCNLRLNYLESNLGCKLGVFAALDWFFAQNEYGIILEDDIYPSEHFLPYCECILQKYRNNLSVGHVSGACFTKSLTSLNQKNNASYYLSNYSFVWGWASWRRSWQLCDKNLDSLKSLRTHLILLKSLGFRQYLFWTSRLLEIMRGKLDTWDYIWSFSLIVNRQYSINATSQLVRNVGFGQNATHTIMGSSPLSEIDTISFPLIDPELTVNKEYDRFLKRNNFSNTKILAVIVEYYRKKFHR